MKNDCNTPKCDPCEKMFEENLHHLIDEARPVRGAEHDAREKELNAAFGKGQPSAEKTSAGHPLGDMPDAKRE